MDNQNQAVPDNTETSRTPVTIDVSAFPTLEILERQYITLALEKVGGNKAKAAQILGVSIKTVYNKLHEYGMLEAKSE